MKANQKTPKISNFDKFLNTYSGKSLLQKHKLTDTGLWRIKGEDPNCDFGGSHYQPDLGTVEGTLKDVIEYAVDLGAFWQWGAGGTIELVNIIKVDPIANKRRAELVQEAKELEARLKEINKELKGK